MAKKKGARTIFGLVCTICKSRNYVSERNKVNTEEKLRLSKFCKICRKKTEHKENAKMK
jgi:large subunit ribosomal protein L33